MIANGNDFSPPGFQCRQITVLCCVTKVEGATSELIVIVRMVHS